MPLAVRKPAKGPLRLLLEHLLVQADQVPAVKLSINAKRIM